MTSPLRKLWAVKREYNVPDESFRAILKGQTGSFSSKNLGWPAVEACCREMEKYAKPEQKEALAEKNKNWRPKSKNPSVRKVHALWGILRRAGVVRDKFPDAFVKKIADVDRAEFLTPYKANKVIEGLKEWIIREGLKSELRD